MTIDKLDKDLDNSPKNTVKLRTANNFNKIKVFEETKDMFEREDVNGDQSDKQNFDQNAIQDYNYYRTKNVRISDKNLSNRQVSTNRFRLKFNSIVNFE